jgi:uncharacterized protein
MKTGIIMTLLLVTLMGCKERPAMNVLVIAGGHGYDTLAVNTFFNELEGMNTTFLMQPQANQFIESGMADQFDVLVFYDSWQEISEQEKQGYLRLLDKGTGMVFLHHALVSYQQWPEFMQIIGGKYRHPNFESDQEQHSDYRHDILMKVVANPDHPVTQGVGEFEIYDEGYMNLEILSTVTPLLETNHQYSDDLLGWAHRVRNANVVYLLPGHGAPAFENSTYRRIIVNAITWAAAESQQ